MLLCVSGCNFYLLKLPTFWGPDSPTGSRVPKATLIVNSLSVYKILYQKQPHAAPSDGLKVKLCSALLLTWPQVNGKCGRWKLPSTTAFVKESPFCLFNNWFCPVKGMGVDLTIFSLLLDPYSSLPTCSSSCPVGWWESLQVNIDFLFVVIQQKGSTLLFTCIASLLSRGSVPEK